MSRMEKKPVPVPKGVTATVDGQTVKVKGPKGELSRPLVDDVVVKMGESGVEVSPRDDSKRARSMWGMSRSLVDNLVGGVANGFTRTLEITGVAYRAALKGKDCKLQIGYTTMCSILPIPRAFRSSVPSRGNRDQRQRQGEGRPGRRRDPAVPQAGAL